MQISQANTNLLETNIVCISTNGQVKDTDAEKSQRKKSVSVTYPPSQNLSETQYPVPILQTSRLR